MDDESENYDAFETFMIEQDIFELPNEDQLIELYEIYPTMPQAFVQELNEYQNHHENTQHLKEINQEIKDIKGFFDLPRQFGTLLIYRFHCIFKLLWCHVIYR
jgi:hypothetical protein